MKVIKLLLSPFVSVPLRSRSTALLGHGDHNIGMSRSVEADVLVDLTNASRNVCGITYYGSPEMETKLMVGTN
jgi:hypothetical protein